MFLKTVGSTWNMGAWKQGKLIELTKVDRVIGKGEADYL